ncbi:molybdopterin-binding protein [Sulfurospirillum sp. 1307]|jgi:molybdopterin biosynthesis enzyme
MKSYEEALEIIKNKIIPIKLTKMTPLLNSTKHICAQRLRAKTSIPATNIALKDGYAYLDKIEVSTGDILNDDVKYVIPFEENQNQSNIPLFYNIKLKAEDIKKDEVLIDKGDFINAYTITALAAQGFKKIKVYKRPKVSILSIGNNLCPVQKEKKDDEVYNSNAFSLASRVLELGGQINKVWQAKNSFADILECLDTLSLENDLIITTGAMSHKDAMNQLIYNDKFEVLFHKVQIAPARPSALTLYNNIPILHLPGLPLSSLLGFELLGAPLLKHLKNENYKRDWILVKNATNFDVKEDCASAIPGYFDGKIFKSASSYKAGMLNTLAKCNGYALIENQSIIKQGDDIKFFSF